LLTTTYQLKERIKIMNEQEQQMMCISPNGDLRSKKENYEKFFIQRRIRELEQELKHLRSQLIPSSSSDDL
ncbi:unnamed protein product, partial [Rotaria magnacalcarata]